jgi:hypothetical protein
VERERQACSQPGDKEDTERDQNAPLPSPPLRLCHQRVEREGKPSNRADH